MELPIESIETLNFPKELQEEFERYPISKEFFSKLEKNQQVDLLNWVNEANTKVLFRRRMVEVIAFGAEEKLPKSYLRKLVKIKTLVSN
jgi:uncharacterized protein YdeI (YjbR/CyaY-like superfamily)